MAGRKQPSATKKAYLLLYNGVSAASWAILGSRVALALAAGKAASLSPGIDAFARNVQTPAIMEILHAVAGELALITGTHVLFC